MENENSKIADCGRILNRFMSVREIVNYLGINNTTKEKQREVVKEFKEFEKEYKSKNVDFAMNKDLIGKVLNSGKFISAFTL